MSDRTIQAFGEMWSLEELQNAGPDGRPRRATPTHTLTASGGGPSVLEVAKQIAKRRGLPVADVEAALLSDRKRRANAPPPVADAPVKIDRAQVAKTIAHQQGIPLARAQQIATKALDDGHRQQMKDAFAAENDAKMRATSASLTPEQCAEHFAVVVCRDNADAPPNTLASLTARRLVGEGFAEANAQRLAVAAVNEVRGLPAVSLAEAAKQQTEAPILMRAREISKTLGPLNEATRLRHLSVIAFRLTSEGIEKREAWRIAGEATQ